MGYLRLIRFPNLLIVALTQFLLQYLLLVPAFNENGLQAALDFPHFSLLVLSTILIAASGYVINDLLDYPIDVLNKPEKLIIQRQISKEKAGYYYWALIALGFVISCYLAWYVNNFPLVLIYPSAVYLLYWYSRSLKARVLWGNIVVAVFCAFVAGIVIFAERETVRQLYQSNAVEANETVFLFMAYLLFAFLSTLLREIIKDMEDVFGDEQEHCRTLPIVWGMGFAKKVALFFGVLLFGFLVFGGGFMAQREEWMPLLFLILGIVLPLVYVLRYLWKAEQKEEFHFLSQACKYIMLAGIIWLLIY